MSALSYYLFIIYLFIRRICELGTPSQSAHPPVQPTLILMSYVFYLINYISVYLSTYYSLIDQGTSWFWLSSVSWPISFSLSLTIVPFLGFYGSGDPISLYP